MAEEVVVYSSINVAECHLVRSLLLREGIVTRLRGQHLAALAGEIPFGEARCELLVAAPDAAAAAKLLRDARDLELADRPCPTCGEANPGAFELCWQCGADLPATPRGPRPM